MNVFLCQVRKKQATNNKSTTNGSFGGCYTLIINYKLQHWSRAAWAALTGHMDVNWLCAATQNQTLHTITSKIANNKRFNRKQLNTATHESRQKLCGAGFTVTMSKLANNLAINIFILIFISSPRWQKTGGRNVFRSS